MVGETQRASVVREIDDVDAHNTFIEDCLPRLSEEQTDFGVDFVHDLLRI